MMVKSAIGAAIALVVLVAATGCGMSGTDSGEERPAPRRTKAEWTPEAELPKDVRVEGRRIPRNGGSGASGYDYAGAARGVLELEAALALMEYARGGPERALEHTVPKSRAAEVVSGLAETAAESETVPVGTYVLRDFEVSGYAADLLEIDVCVDKRDVELRPAEGGAAKQRPDINEDVWWAGFTMRTGDDDTWLAEDIELTPVGADRSHPCT